MRAGLAALVLLGCFLPATLVEAQDVEIGRQTAAKWCSGCHQIDPQSPVSNDTVPSFASIARMSSTTEMSLAAFLSTSHNRMPDFSLTRTEIRDVSAYILSLKQPVPRNRTD